MIYSPSLWSSYLLCSCNCHASVWDTNSKWLQTVCLYCFLIVYATSVLCPCCIPDLEVRYGWTGHWGCQARSISLHWVNVCSIGVYFAEQVLPQPLFSICCSLSLDICSCSLVYKLSWFTGKMILLTCSCYSINSTATTETSCCTCLCNGAWMVLSTVYSYSNNSSAETINMLSHIPFFFNSSTTPPVTLSATLTIACIVWRWSHVEFSVYK